MCAIFMHCIMVIYICINLCVYRCVVLTSKHCEGFTTGHLMSHRIGMQLMSVQNETLSFNLVKSCC